MKLTEARTRELLAQAGAVINGHFVGTNGKHLSLYVAKDRATRLTSIGSELCSGIAERFAGDDVDAVVAPAVGAIALSQWGAYHLTRLRSDRPEVLALYSEHDDRVIWGGVGNTSPMITLTSGLKIALTKGEKVIIRRPRFVFKRGFNVDVRGMRILVVEDTLITGGSAARTVRATVSAGGIVVAVGVLVNGGKVTAADIGVNRLEALIDVERQIFTEDECADHGLCADNVPINTDFGHGAAFLARKAAEGKPA